MKTSHLSSLLVAAIAASQLGATDCGQIITDRGFDLWCGDRLCYWKLERGQVQRVPTWIEGDDGVSMVGDDVAFSQMTTVTSYDTACIQFDLVADIEPTADVTLEADVFGDGTVDWSQRIPTSDWEKQTLLIGLDGPYDGIRFRLTKQGSGRAVLARIGAKVADANEDCPTFVPVPSRPNGATCEVDGQCLTETCTAGVCSDCHDDSECTGGDVCGAAQHTSGWLSVWSTCVPPASHDLGERCHEDAECATGVCNGIACSECSNTVACAGGAACTFTDTDTWVSQCAPGGGDRAAGAACVTDADCASGACAGTDLGHCDDGPLPCFSDIECPPHADLTWPTCTFDAVAGGTCQ